MLHLANGSVEGVIWLVIIILWGLAQMVNAIKNSQNKNGGRPRPGGTGPQRPPKGNMPTSLPEFLESLFQQGQPQPKAQPPKPSIKPNATYTTTKPQTSQASADKNAKRRKLKMKRDAEQADAFAIRQSGTSTGMRSFKLPNFRLPATGEQLKSSNSDRKPTINFNLRDGESFKRAILTRTVIGPPKALEDDPFLSNY